MAWAAVLRTYGDMSDAASLMANIMMGTIMGTRMLDRTRRALARISWLGSYGDMWGSCSMAMGGAHCAPEPPCTMYPNQPTLSPRWKVEMESRARSCCSSA